jgi:hypothetical protein
MGGSSGHGSEAGAVEIEGHPTRSAVPSRQSGEHLIREVAPLFCTAFQPEISGFTGGVRPLSEVKAG